MKYFPVIKTSSFLWVALGASLIVHGVILVQPSLSGHLSWKPDSPTGPLKLKIQAMETPGALPFTMQKGPSSAPKMASGVFSANQLLADPILGQIFSEYFNGVKRRIVMASKKYPRHPEGQERVSLAFVLKNNGRIASIEFMNQGSRRDAHRQNAVGILKAAQPFDRFPAAIPHPEISFQITMRFDTTD